jgi:hypothetical protein
VYRADENTADRLRELVRARLAEPRKTRAAVRRSNVAAIQHRTRLLEEKAQTIEAFQPSTVVGLVQSKAFVRAVVQSEVADAEQAISERLARQRQIVGSDKQVTIIHTEGALRAHLRSPAVMTAQLDELAKLATAASNLRIDTIPWTQPLSRPLMSGFRLFDRTVLAVSSEIGEVFIEDPTEGRNERPVRPAHRVGRLRRGCCRDRTANRGRLQEPVTADGSHAAAFSTTIGWG